VPVLYYVAPQLWASRAGRMKLLRRDVRQLACILPFEEPYFRANGVNATFVGHPLFDELPKDRMVSRQVRAFGDSPRVGIVAGSRGAEVESNLPHLLDVAGMIAGQFSGVRFLLPTTEQTDERVRAVVERQVEKGGGDLRPRIEIKCDAFDELIPRCDLCLCKSGTSTLHVAAWGVPLIVVYRVHPLIWHGAGRWIVKTRKIALVNILAGNVDAVPEFVPWYGSNEPVAKCAIELLRDPAKLAEQKKTLAKIIAPLDRPGASINVAKMVLEMVRGGKGV
jgi:lipid-A-disaccharide synthase